MKFNTINELPKAHREQAAEMMLASMSTSSKEMLQLKKLVATNQVENLEIYRPSSPYSEVGYFKDTKHNRTMAVRYIGNFTYRITMRDEAPGRKILSQVFIDKEKISFNKNIHQTTPDSVIFRKTDTPPTLPELLLLILK